MKAACWEGKLKVEVRDVPEPRVVNPHDVVIRVDETTICGSDLHLYDGVVPGMRKGDIVGHEPVGTITAAGPQVKKHKEGDRVLVSSVIACGQCAFCQRGEHSLCDNSNPNAWLQEKAYTYGTAGFFGYSHLFGGYPGAQAESLRVPYADVGVFSIPEGLSNEQAVCLCDAFPTGYMGADLCGLAGGETVAVWGAGPVGLFAMASAKLMGAGRVFAVDCVPERLAMARDRCGAEPVDFTHVAVTEFLRDATGGRGPDCCLDAVGMEAHGLGAPGLYDRVKQAVRAETDRGYVVRQMIEACRKGGTVVIMGVYGMFVDKVPLGAAFNKGLRFHMGQMHGPRYIPKLLELATSGAIDPSFPITHRFTLDEIPKAYELFKNREQGVVKVGIKVH